VGSVFMWVFPMARCIGNIATMAICTRWAVRPSVIRPRRDSTRCPHVDAIPGAGIVRDGSPLQADGIIT